ncbi:MAG: aspartate kinase [Myxococcota bacterium]
MAAEADQTPKPGDSRDKWVVLKFGGTSVSKPENWDLIASQLRERIEEGLRPVVVCSALATVSDTLEGLLAGAQMGRDPKEALDALRATHHKLGDALGIDTDAIIGPYLEDLERLAKGAHMIEQAPARLRARVMSAGELMSTRMGVAWLQEQGLSVAWCDAREILEAETPPAGASEANRYLSATCAWGPDEKLQRSLGDKAEQVLVTQGFIGSDDSGATVLLGRGGSDTSAAYLASRLGAARLEIWTDVPGMFTANPKHVDNPRLLRRLDYDEAQMLAARGAGVLHPRCIPPVRDEDIPLHIRCTTAPHLEGTVIKRLGEDEQDPAVKAVSSRSGLTLITLRWPARWQVVGLIADVTAVFKQHGVSIDMISTSPSHIALTLDPAATQLSEHELQTLSEELSEHGKIEVRTDVASVSLVGHGIRDMLHKLGPGMAPLEDANIHMVSQTASDLSLSFVVDSADEEPLLKRFHDALMAGGLPEQTFGPGWKELM